MSVMEGRPEWEAYVQVIEDAPRVRTVEKALIGAEKTPCLLVTLGSGEQAAISWSVLYQLGFEER